MDTNLPSGESLVRQFLYGQRFFQSRFGSRCRTFVLPDTFGYSSQLPQLARSAGCDYFFTQKLSWNNINQFPHTSFNWAGLDGTQVLTHMTPVDTYGLSSLRRSWPDGSLIAFHCLPTSYNAQADFGELKKGAENNKNLEVTGDALFLFGNGDGGGGPTAPMLEKVGHTLLAALLRRIP
jgi:alpha-mannosidase